MEEEIAEEAAPQEQPPTAEEAFLNRLQPPEEEEPALEEEQPDAEEDLDDEVVLEEQSDEPVFTIKAAGEEHTLTLDELQERASQGIDYTRKTQSLAAERKQVTERFQQLEELQAKMAAAAQTQPPVVEQHPPEYWQELQQSDPVRYLIERDQYREKQAAAQAAQQQQQEIAEQYQYQQQQEAQAQLQQAHTQLIDQFPEWSDPEKFSAAKLEMRSAGLKLGYSDEELSQVYDARAVLALQKAAAYDRLMEKKESLKSAPPKTPQGHSARPGRKSNLRKAKEQLAKTGRTRDAEAAFKAIIDKRR
tara:strand:+ start:2962 stop:3876 length:915 start_codon:yes stop_codon:yes gene_type:complete